MNKYKEDISESILIEAIKKINQTSLPIRYVLVDDGHLDSDNRRLRSFRPNSKFPNGWEPIISLRDNESEKNIKWIGLWINFNGYWDALCPENDFGDELNSRMMPVTSKRKGRDQHEKVLPDNDPASPTAFYNAMVGTARQHGFDFLKVDNQAENLNFYVGTEQPVEVSVRNSQALETACAEMMDGLINCMAHGPTCIFNTKHSAVTRCSEDYFAGDLKKARRHIHNSYVNMLLFGWTGAIMTCSTPMIRTPGG